MSEQHNQLIDKQITMMRHTKLFKPQLRPSLVPRTRLIETLNQGRRGKLTLVSAPAGYGKTTLVVDWLNQLPIKNSCWLSLDEDDNDATQFWMVVIASLQTVNAQLGANILPILRDVPATALSHQLTNLVNEIVATQQELLLVLDDYHVIHNQDIHETIAFWLMHMPPQMHLVITSRADPPLPLSRLRVRGQMTEIRAENLRFTEAETAVFLNDLMHLNLTLQDVAALDGRTEGWIASLQLAALAMQSPTILPEDRHQFITKFTGSDRYIVDYLVEEVLHGQPLLIQDFLLQTAVLDQLYGPLCDAVLAIGDSELEDDSLTLFRTNSPSQKLLEQLDTANLFLISLDNQREWYRYHHLFRDWLQYRLLEAYPQRVAELHQRASQWYEQNGFPEAAIAHSLAAEAFQRAAQLIEQHAHDLFRRGKIMRLRQWLDILPSFLIHSRPQLFLVYGWMLLRMGQFRALVAHLNNLSVDEAMMAVDLAIFRAYIALFQGDFTRSTQLAQQALSLAPPDNMQVRLAAMNQLARSYDVAGNATKAIECATELVRMGREMNSPTPVIAGLGQLVQLHAEVGQLHQAKAAFDQAIAYATERGNNHIPLLGPVYIGMGYVDYQQGDLETAVTHLHEGIARCRQWGGIIIFVARKGYRLLTQILQEQGNAAAAKDILIEAVQLAQENDIPDWAMKWVENQAVAPLPAPAHLESLTNREQDVLRLLANGRSSPQIAAELVIGVSTVRTHIKNIYGKLDVHSRHEAITRAKELGLL